jgi:hypothetical protein
MPLLRHTKENTKSISNKPPLCPLRLCGSIRFLLGSVIASTSEVISCLGRDCFADARNDKKRRDSHFLLNDQYRYFRVGYQFVGDAS